jgi:anion transporter
MSLPGDVIADTGHTLQVPDAAAAGAPEGLVRNVPFFHDLSRLDTARLLGALEEVTYPAGTVIVQEGEPADALYLVERGRVNVGVGTAQGERSLAALEAPAHFGELGLLLERRTATVTALTDVRLWRLSRERFEHLGRERPDFALSVATAAVAVLERSQRALLGAPVARSSAPETDPALESFCPPPRTTSPPRRLAGALVTVGIPLLLWFLPAPFGLTEQGWHVGLILLGAVLGWLFEPLPDFAVALLMAAAWGIAGLAPLSMVLAGFASSAWIVSLGAFSLAVALAQSGLLFRAALMMLRRFPATHTGQVMALLIGGVATTPLVPLALARIAVAGPLAAELAQVLGYPRQSRASAALGMAALMGHGLFGSVFLTGMVMNFVVLDLLPPGEAMRFGWVTWVTSAAPAGVVLLAGAALTSLVLFRPEMPPKATLALVHRQERVLGPLSRPERVTLVAVAVLLSGLVFQPLFQIDPAWLAVGALSILIGGGALDRDRFRKGVDWGLMTLFGVLLGAGNVLRHAGLDAWISQSLVPLARAAGDPGVFVLLLGAFVVVCRLVVPWIPATVLLILALVPAATQLGLSPWVAGFVVLLAVNTWVHPSQSDFVRFMRQATDGQLFSNRHALVVGMAVTLTTFVALAVSVPYWRALGLLTPAP